MRKSAKQESKRKPLYFLAAILVIFVAYLLVKVVQKKDVALPVKQVDSTVETINPVIALPTAKPIELVANSKSDGPLVAKMSEKTTLDDLEKAIKFLPDGESFSCSVYSGVDKVEVLRIDKAKGKIRSVYIDGDYVDDLVGEQSSYKLIDWFVKQAKAFNVLDYLGNSLDTVDDSMTLEEQVASLRSTLNKILSLVSGRGNGGNYPVISVFSTPSTGISVTNYVNRCVSSGGTWNSFSSLAGSALKSKVCSYSTDIATQSKLSVLRDNTNYRGSNCECPAGQCLNLEDLSERGRYDSSGYSTIFELRGYCSGGSSVVNTSTVKNNCTSSGGLWTESGDSLTHYAYCTCPSGYRLRGEKCQVRGGWGNNCDAGQIDVGNFIGRKNSCFDATTLESNCKLNNGSWINYGMENSGSLVVSNPPSHFCGRSEKALFKQQNCSFGENGGSCSSTAYPFLGCVCPAGQCLNSEVKCIPDTYNNDAKETACTNSGGTWKQFSNKYNADREKCEGASGEIGVTLWNPVESCDCPSGKCLSSSDNKCVSGDSSQGACEQSGGVWREALDAPQYSYCQCSGDTESTLAPHLRSTFPRTCVQASEVDCGSDKQCFYRNIDRGRKTKIAFSEIKYSYNNKITQTNTITSVPRGGGFLQADISIKISGISKTNQAENVSNSSSVLYACQKAVDGITELEGLTATCTVNTSDQAEIIVDSGLTERNISRYNCYGELINAARRLCQ